MGGVAEPRHPMQARLTPRAYQGWDKFLTLTGCNFTTIVEALGLALAKGDGVLSDEIIGAARTIDRARKSRKR